MNINFKAKRIDNGEWVTGFFTKKKIGSLIVPVIEVYKEWDTGDYMESYQINGDTLEFDIDGKVGNKGGENKKPALLSPPILPLTRCIREGSVHFCAHCGSTLARNGFLGLFGERLCINPDCPNSHPREIK